MHQLAERPGVGQRQFSAAARRPNHCLRLTAFAADAQGDRPLQLLELLAQESSPGQRQLLVTVEAGKLADHLQQRGAGSLVVPEAILNSSRSRGATSSRPLKKALALMSRTAFFQRRSET